MAKSEWGSKCLCNACGARFYDLKRNPVACPKCGAAHRVEQKPKAKREAAPVAEPVATPAEPISKESDGDTEADVLAEEGVDVLEDGEDVKAVQGGEDHDGLIEDASELGEDEDDVSEVLEHVDEGVADIG